MAPHAATRRERRLRSPAQLEALRRFGPGGQATELKRALEARVDGEVRFDAGSRALYATDGSNYRQVPIGVVVPKDLEAVVETVAVCRAFGAPIVSRGGGTSLAGQTTNVAVVVDWAKYLHRIVDVDPGRKLARVQPGVILDALRKVTQPLGLTYGPDPATHTHCTFGGMIGNNSCGIHAVLSEFYGPGPRTSDNVHSLDVLTYDGERMTVGPTSDEALSAILAAGGRRARLYAGLRDLRDRYADAIRRRFPRIPRRVSGYNLDALLPENGFDVAQALVGTEGTCATVLEATVKLSPHFPHLALVVLGYPSLFEAGDHVEQIRAHRPIGFEGLDDQLVRYMRVKGMHESHLRLLPEGGGWLLVEFGAEDPEELRARVDAFTRDLGRGRGAPTVAAYFDPQAQARVWEIRESGLGATAFVPGERDAWPGWEDAAVPPAHVGAYLREFRALLDRHGYACALYGHLGQGCIHTRIDFDLQSRAGIERFRRFTREAAELVVRHGGALSGEHGDGQARGDLLPLMYGDELVSAFREFKALWDPEGRMNPGKVVDTPGRTEDLRLEGYRPGRPDTAFGFGADGGDFAHAALRCVGVGKCRRDEGGTMCPSYRVTHEEKHTTRGRAHLLFEMLHGEVIRDGWNSEEVKESLDLCLSCKGCKGDCPVNVDIATYKAEFLHHYYRSHRRPLHAYAFGLIDRWAALAGRMPGLANLASHAPGLSSLAKAVVDVHPARDLPYFAPMTFRRWHRRRGPTPVREAVPGRRVILWADTFNEHLKPETLAATLEVLESAGCEVVVPRRQLCCGRPLYDFGLLDRARAYHRRTLRALEAEIRAGTPVVGIEPSCVSSFRDELPDLFPDDALARRLSRQTWLLSEYLMEVLPDYQPPRLARKAVLHGHCHHTSVLGLDAEEALFRRMGLDFRALDSGCCGMAGPFGYEKDKYEVSMAAGERVLLPAVREADDHTIVIADGYSCREQVAHGTRRRPLTTAEVVQLALHQDALGVPRGTPEDQHRALVQAALREAPRGPSPRGALWGAAGVAAAGLAGWALRRTL